MCGGGGGGGEHIQANGEQEISLMICALNNLVRRPLAMLIIITM